MQLKKYDPFSDIQKIERDFDNLWRGWLPGNLTSIAKSAPLDMYEQDGKVVAKLALPNFTSEEIDVKVGDGMLEISAEHTEKQESDNDRRYYVRESSNRYLRRVPLPENADGSKAEADFEDGTLTITMPCPPAKPAKKLTVKNRRKT